MEVDNGSAKSEQLVSSSIYATVTLNKNPQKYHLKIINLTSSQNLT